MWRDPYPAEVEAVGIPTSLYGDVGMGSLMGMPRTGLFEKVKLVIGQVEQTVTKRSGKLGGTGAMIRIRSFVDPLRVMKNRE